MSQFPNLLIELKTGNLDKSFNTIAKHCFCLFILKSTIPAKAKELDRKARLLAL